ncbi:hypothetical protein [Sphingobacterium kitahiroshimense]|uniref:Uncharacterized protein n=1 Tax=Sphingobacterium kitahiroshimense TaxID=470446 RepID=A0ABV0C1A0_9SPHI
MLGLIFVAACGNTTNNNGNNADSVSTDTMMQTDTTIQDTSIIQYRDSNSTEPNGAIPPTS